MNKDEGPDGNQGDLIVDEGERAETPAKVGSDGHAGVGPDLFAEQALCDDAVILAGLSRLPSRDVDPWRAQRIRTLALVEMSRAQEARDHPWRSLLRRVYWQGIEPGFVTATTIIYLSWAFSAVAAILT